MNLIKHIEDIIDLYSTERPMQAEQLMRATLERLDFVRTKPESHMAVIVLESVLQEQLYLDQKLDRLFSLLAYLKEAFKERTNG